MGGHGRRGLMVGGGKMIPHGGWQLSEENPKEDGVILVAACGDQGEHLVHHVRGASVAEGRHVEQGVHLLPLRLPVACCEACLQLLVCVRGVGLHTVHQVPDRHDHGCG